MAFDEGVVAVVTGMGGSGTDFESAVGSRSFPDNVKLSFGTGNDSQIYYDDTDTFWDLRAVGTGALMIALAGSFPSPDGSAVHIWAGNSGSVTANASSRLVVESGGRTILQLLALNSNSSDIFFGSPASNQRGFITYGGSTDSPADTFIFGTAAIARLHISAGAFAFQEATVISTTAGDLKLNPSGAIDANGNLIFNVDTIRGRSGIDLEFQAFSAVGNPTANRLILETLDTVGNAAVNVAYAEPTATETTPFWAQRGDVTTPLVGTLDASFLTFKWDPADDSVTVYVNDGGTIRSVAIGTVT